MPDLPAMHWLWLFGTLSLGIVAGWLAYPIGATRWSGRPIHIALGAVAICVLLAIATTIPARYGYWLECGAVLALVGAIGGFVGWALRDLADFMPPATEAGPAGSGTAASAATASAVASGSYLFREALAGTSAGPAYMRTTRHGGATRVRTSPSAEVLTRAPAPGGYTFPETLPFADAPTLRRAEPTTGLRRHWTWPIPSADGPTGEPD